MSGERLARWWPVATVIGLWIGYGIFREGPRADYTYRTSMCAVGAILVLARAYAPKDAALAKVLLTLVLFGWAGTTLGGHVGRDLDRMVTKGELRYWSHYHYYLGAKYFAELGYDGLYDQTVAVDAAHDRRFRTLLDIRDLRTYDRVPIRLDQRVRSDAWSDARWQQFSADVLWFQPKFDDGSWRRILRDRGYNATPAGGALYRLAAQLSLDQRTLFAVGLIDPLLLLIAFVVVGRVFGPLKALLAAAWFQIFFGNEFHTVGGPVLHDWLVALLLMACAVHRNRPMLGGMLLGYAAMVRVFPGFLLAGLVVWTFVTMRKAGAFPRFTNRFGRGVLAAVAVMFVVGCFTGRGLQAWPEWAANIELHRAEHRFGDKRIGLQHPFTHPLGKGLSDFGPKTERRATWPDQKRYWLAAAAVLLALWAVAALRAGDERDPLDAMVFALPVLFAVLVLSRYYWTVACLFFLLGGRERDGPREAWLGGGMLLWCAVQYAWQLREPDDFGWYVVANWLLLGFFAVALAIRTRRASA